MISITGHTEGDSALLKFKGKLVSEDLDQPRQKIKNYLQQGVRSVTMDMSKVTFIDSSGIGLLAATYNSVSKLGGELKIIGLSDEIYDSFINLRLHTIFKIERCKKPADNETSKQQD